MAEDLKLEIEDLTQQQSEISMMDAFAKGDSDKSGMDKNESLFIL